MSSWETALLIVSSMVAGGILVAAACVMWVIRNNPWR